MLDGGTGARNDRFWFSAAWCHLWCLCEGVGRAAKQPIILMVSERGQMTSSFFCSENKGILLLDFLQIFPAGF